MRSSASCVRSASERGGCSSASAEASIRPALVRGLPGMDRGDAQSFRGPSDVEADDIAFANQIDPGHIAADSRAQNGHERKFKRDLLAAMRSDHATAARAIELEDHSLVEITGKPLAVEFVGHVRSVASRGAPEKHRFARCGARRTFHIPLKADK